MAHSAGIFTTLSGTVRLRIVLVFLMMVSKADMISSFMITTGKSTTTRASSSTPATGSITQQQMIPLRYHLHNSNPRFSPSSLASTRRSNRNNSNYKVGQRSGLITRTTQRLDTWIVHRVIKVANHIPTLASIAYFGLISMAMMMKPAGGSSASLVSVLTQQLGATSNLEFSVYFATLITPPAWIFFIWPFIALIQVLTVVYSALRGAAVRSRPRSTSSSNDDDWSLLKQDDLTALSIANILAAVWLFVSSKATATVLPLGSVGVLPLVPWISGYPLRQRQKQQQRQRQQQQQVIHYQHNWKTVFVFQVYSSFTTIAAFLAVATELQYGGRILPSIFRNQAELCAMVFLTLVGRSVVTSSSSNSPKQQQPQRSSGGGSSSSSSSSSSTSTVSKIINAVVLWGILSKRLLLHAGVTGAARASASSFLSLLFGSISFLTTFVLALISLSKIKDPFEHQ